jgi:hypothetical protein
MSDAFFGLLTIIRKCMVQTAKSNTLNYALAPESYWSVSCVPMLHILYFRVFFCLYRQPSSTFCPGINPLTPELNPSEQRCLTRFFAGDFAS